MKTERTIPMRSPVNWTVLGLVIERSSYGWELWTRFERLYDDVMPTRTDLPTQVLTTILSET